MRLTCTCYFKNSTHFISWLKNIIYNLVFYIFFLLIFFHRYFIPEDGDDPEHPNVFKLPKDSPLTLGEIKRYFPVPGQYHFRFLRTIESNLVWMDVTDDSQRVPTQNNSIVAKVSRIASPSTSGTNKVRNSTLFAENINCCIFFQFLFT